MVPFRAIAETLKATVNWNPDERSVTVTRGGSTMVPVQFVSEALNANVQWEAETQFVVINP